MSAKKPQRNGKPASMGGGPPLKEYRRPSKELQKLLASVYNYYQHLDDRAVNAEVRRDFVFHMTDWLDDLDRIKAVYDHPEPSDRRAAAQDIAEFLYHVTAHIMEAARLLLDYEPGYIFESPKPIETTSRKASPRR
jgi:hypothetical protein